MLAEAQAKAPELTWRHGDLAEAESVTDIGPVDLVLLAGNVMIFLEPDTEARVLGHLAGRLKPGGLLVAGFSLTGGLTPQRYDRFAAAAGLHPVDRWATWDRRPFEGGDYVVAVHRAER